MKKFFLYLLPLVMLCVACATSEEARQRKMEQKMLVAQRVKQQINDMRFRIYVDVMHPTRYPARHLTSAYYLEVKGDSVVSYLPYMGRAFNVPYGGGKALNFEGKLLNSEVQQERSDRYMITLEVSNDEDIYRYIIDTFDNGSSTIFVYARERESISFSGRMEVNEE